MLSIVTISNKRRGYKVIYFFCDRYFFCVFIAYFFTLYVFLSNIYHNINAIINVEISEKKYVNQAMGVGCKLASRNKYVASSITRGKCDKYNEYDMSANPLANLVTCRSMQDVWVRVVDFSAHNTRKLTAIPNAQSPQGNNQFCVVDHLENTIPIRQPMIESVDG